MTELLFRQDAYCTEAEGTVRSHLGEQGILLDRVLFYPTGGGQSHDVGTLNGVPVVDVQVAERRQGVIRKHAVRPDEQNCVRLEPRRFGEIAERALVMKDGRIVEEAPVRRLFTVPQHTHTQTLLADAQGSASR